MTTEEILLTAFRALLLLALVICAIATAVSKRPMTAVIIFTSYSIVMSILWLLLESPDLAITEAAVGAGITGILFYLTLHRLHRIQRDHDQIPDHPKTPAEPSVDERKGAEEQ
jgi:uncharacterized MnhB-related membrane protein